MTGAESWDENAEINLEFKTRHLTLRIIETYASCLAYIMTILVSKLNNIQNPSVTFV